MQANKSNKERKVTGFGVGEVGVRFTGRQFEDHADKSSRERAKAGFIKQAEVGNTRTSIQEKSLGG